ncbi:MAG: hypothetical protein QF449_00780 [Alphaproteobacteria bacterium]|jgi:tetratricopeptide (TPR) repeat protein|nr:hypothetical protein [Alphaproteobacteria bacterium]
MGQARTTEAFFYKTVAKHQQGDLRGAEKGYRKILRHAPNNVATLINFGILLKERDELTKAFELFTQAVSLAPEHADSLYTRAGSFRQDNLGNLRNTGGFFLQGWPLDANGRLPGGRPANQGLPFPAGRP